MHINKTILFTELQAFIEQKYRHTDKDLLIELCHKIIHYAPTQNCIIKSKRSAWQGVKELPIFSTSSTHFASQVRQSG